MLIYSKDLTEYITELLIQVPKVTFFIQLCTAYFIWSRAELPGFFLKVICQQLENFIRIIRNHYSRAHFIQVHPKMLAVSIQSSLPLPLNIL